MARVGPQSYRGKENYDVLSSVQQELSMSPREHPSQINFKISLHMQHFQLFLKNFLQYMALNRNSKLSPNKQIISSVV